MTMRSRILIAGMGNVLRSDDGFGVEVVRQLSHRGCQSEQIEIVEVGIGGIHLVQELLSPQDVLILIDAVELGASAGTVQVLEIEAGAVASLSEHENLLADVHYTLPSRVLMLAKALGVLPPRVFLVGGQPADADTPGIGLSDSVQQAVNEAIREVERLIRRIHAQPSTR